MSAFSVGRAAKYTHVAANQTNSSIESGESIQVYGVQVEGTAAGQVILEESDGSTVITQISVPANGSAFLDVIWIADKGLNVTTPANVTCTVFHSQGGA